MKSIFSFLFVLLAFCAGAQKDWSQQYGQVISQEELKKHLYVIASDAYEGRETGMEGQRKAAQYLDEYYAGIGIKTQRQIFPLKRLSFLESTVLLDTKYGIQKTYSFIKDFYFFSADRTQTVEVNELVFVGYGISEEGWDDYKGLDVKGKTIICLSGEPVKKGKSLITGKKEFSKWTLDREVKRKAAIEKGAKMFIQIDQNFDQYMSRVKYYLQTPRMTLDKKGSEDEEDLRIPYLHCSIKMAEDVLAEMGLPNHATLVKKAMKRKSFIQSASSHHQGQLPREKRGLGF